MIGLRKRMFFRIITFILVGIMAIQGEGLIMAAASQEQVKDQAQQQTQDDTTKVPADPLETKFEDAKKLYFSEDFEGAKDIMEQLVVDLENIEGREILKGEANLLMGAVYEALDYKKLSIRYYCVAKDLLGKDKSFEGLDLKELKWYRKKCPATAVIPTAGARRKKGGSIIGTLLGLALLGGIIWYLFINEKSPLKSDDEDEDLSSLSQTELYQRLGASTFWYNEIRYQYTGNGKVSLWYRLPDMSWEEIDNSREQGWAPNPNPNNNFKGEKRLKIKYSGSTVLSSSWDFSITIYGCGGLTRRDIVKVDGTVVLDETTTFNNECGSNPTDYEKTYEVYSGSGEKTFTITHELILSVN